MDGGHIALKGAVGFHGDKAALCAKAFALALDDSRVIRVDLRNDHRDVRRAAVCAVVAHHRAFRLGVSFLQRLDLIFLHVDGAEDKIAQGRDLLHILGRVKDRHIRHGGRHGGGHQPMIAHSLTVGFARGTSAGGQGRHFKPGMVFQQGSEALADHAGRADDAYTIRFHFHMPPICLSMPEYSHRYFSVHAEKLLFESKRK